MHKASIFFTGKRDSRYRPLQLFAPQSISLNVFPYWEKLPHNAKFHEKDFLQNQKLMLKIWFNHNHRNFLELILLAKRTLPWGQFYEQSFIVNYKFTSKRITWLHHDITTQIDWLILREARIGKLCFRGFFNKVLIKACFISTIFDYLTS